MAAVTLELDARLFTIDIVSRTAHRYSGKFFVDLRAVDDAVVVELTPRGGVDAADDVASQFRNDALDEKLRATVRAETHGLHEALVRAALIGALDRKGAP